MFSFLLFSARSNKILQRIAPLFNGNNVTFQTMQKVSLSYTNHPLFTSKSRFTFGDLDINSIKFTNSYAKIIKGNFNNINIRNCVFSNSKSPLEVKSGIVYQHKIKEGMILTRKNISLVISSSVFKDLSTHKKQRGGAITATETAIAVARCLFDKCNSIDGGAIYCETVGLELRYVGFHSCNCPLNGGAIYLNASFVDAKMIEFINGEAKFGAAVYAINSQIEMNKVSVTGNTASEGAFFIENTEILFNETFFTNNRGGLTSSTAAIFFQNSPIEIASVHFQNNTNPSGPSILRAKGNSTLKVIESSCFPKNYKLPIHAEGESKIIQLEECPGVTDTMLDTEESDRVELVIKNSTGSFGFALAMLAIIITPFALAFSLPRLL